MVVLEKIEGMNWSPSSHSVYFFPPLSPDGLAAFRAFLKSEFCEENIEFWLACEDFKKTKSPQKLSSKARKIYTDFIEKEAPKEVRGKQCSSLQHILNTLSTNTKQKTSN